MKHRISDPSKVFFTSDTHYDHKNIVRGVTEWTDPPEILDLTTRPFSDTEEMNRFLVESINDTVSENDTLYHLGDVCLSSEYKTLEFISKIRCKHIYLVYGNHDSNIISSRQLRESFAACSYYCELKLEKELFTLFHYPIDDWKNMNKGSFMLHGHQHNRKEWLTASRRMDVGFDAHQKPISLEFIYDTLSKNPVVRNPKYPRLQPRS